MKCFVDATFHWTVLPDLCAVVFTPQILHQNRHHNLQTVWNIAYQHKLASFGLMSPLLRQDFHHSPELLLQNHDLMGSNLQGALFIPHQIRFPNE